MISFIVGTDNSRPHELRRFIEHLQRQTSQDFEIIVADSGDLGGWAVAEYGVRYYRQQDARDWHYSAKNMAARLASGNYLCFPQDDSEYRPRFVELMQAGGMPVCAWNWGNVTMLPRAVIGQIDVGGFTVHRDHFGTGFTPGPLADGRFAEARAHLIHRVPEVLYVKH